MNPKTKKLNVRKCTLCGYPYSDKHHLYPQSWGGDATIVLCPNHHRFANILQILTNRALQEGRDMDSVIDFAKENFDEKFNSIIWKLINGHKEEELRLVDESSGYRYELESFE